MGKIFKTATAFRKSLESRLMNVSQDTNIDLQRLRRKVAFDRLLARFFVNGSNTWVLKGGYALEIRFAHARATKDIDLTAQKNLCKAMQNSLTPIRQASSASDDSRVGVSPTTFERSSVSGAGFGGLLDRRLAVRKCAASAV